MTVENSSNTLSHMFFTALLKNGKQTASSAQSKKEKEKLFKEQGRKEGFRPGVDVLLSSKNRDYLKKEKKLKGGELMAITVENVMEKWLEYVNN